MRSRALIVSGAMLPVWIAAQAGAQGPGTDPHYVAVPLVGAPPIIRPSDPTDAPGGPDWYTIDGGGVVMSGPNQFDMVGTIGQPDAGAMSQPSRGIDLLGGFWPLPEAGGCYANCDYSTNNPILNINDFQCFVNLYAAQDPRANCDGSTNPPILNIVDFQCFVNAYAVGCS